MAKTKKRQYLVDSAGKPVAVVLDLKTFKKMEDDLDDYYCRKEYDRVKKATDDEVRSGKASTIEEYLSARKLHPRLRAKRATA